MKQVMAPEVREHSFLIHEKNRPSFSFMTAKWFLRQRRAFDIKIQITDSGDLKTEEPVAITKSTQCSVWVMLTKENFGSSIFKWLFYTISLVQLSNKKPRIESKNEIEIKRNFTTRN